MTGKRKGHVEFKQTEAKLVAEMAEDEGMREKLNELRLNDGYKESCGINEEDASVTNEEQNPDEEDHRIRSEKLRYQKADEIYD